MGLSVDQKRVSRLKNKAGENIFSTKDFFLFKKNTPTNKVPLKSVSMREMDVQSTYLVKNSTHQRRGYKRGDIPYQTQDGENFIMKGVQVHKQQVAGSNT